MTPRSKHPAALIRHCLRCRRWWAELAATALCCVVMFAYLVIFTA